MIRAFERSGKHLLDLTMRKARLALYWGGLALLIVLLVSCANRNSTWERVQRGGVLHVGLDPTYPPFEFFDGESLHGIDVDLAHAIAAQRGLTVEFSHFGFDGLYDALATEQVDVLISALTPDAGRTRDFAYSDGYVESGLVLVALANDPYQEVSELSGRTVAVELGAAGHVEATTWQRQVENLTVSTHMSADEAMRALVTGEADVAVVDNISFRLFDAQAAGADFISAPLTGEPYALVVRQEDDRLLSELNSALAELRQSGRLEAILNSWFSG